MGPRRIAHLDCGLRLMRAQGSSGGSKTPAAVAWQSMLLPDLSAPSKVSQGALSASGQLKKGDLVTGSEARTPRLKRWRSVSKATIFMKIHILNRKTQSRALSYSLKTSKLMSGDAKTEKDVKNEGRTDYVYERTGPSDKKYFRKTAFCMSFGARPPAPLGDIMPSESRVLHSSRATKDASGG